MHSFRDPVFDRVLDHRLQNQAGNLSRKQVAGHIRTQLKAVRESHLLDVKILLDKLHFLTQRHLLSVGILHHAAQKVAQLRNHVDGSIVSSLAHQSRNGIECIEKKVWLDLSP